MKRPPAPNPAIKIGDRVTIIETGWPSVPPGSTGIVSKITEDFTYVDVVQSYPFTHDGILPGVLRPADTEDQT